MLLHDRFLKVFPKIKKKNIHGGKIKKSSTLSNTKKLLRDPQSEFMKVVFLSIRWILIRRREMREHNQYGVRLTVFPLYTLVMGFDTFKMSLEKRPFWNREIALVTDRTDGQGYNKCSLFIFSRNSAAGTIKGWRRQAAPQHKKSSWMSFKIMYLVWKEIIF